MLPLFSIMTLWPPQTYTLPLATLYMRDGPLISLGHCNIKGMSNGNTVQFGILEPLNIVKINLNPLSPPLIRKLIFLLV